MKTRAFWQWGFGLGLIMVPVALGWLPRQPAPVDQIESDTETAMVFEPANQLEEPFDDAVPVEAPATEALAEAPVGPVANERPLPPSLKPGPPVLEMLKLATSGVEESVMLAFVSNSASPFNLSSDEIIYVTDLGLPPAVVSAMLERDQRLKSADALNAARTFVSFTTRAPPGSAAVMAPVQVDAGEDYATEPFPQAEPPPVQPAEGTTSEFHDSLAPYGTWVEVGGYGPCWRPAVVAVNPGWRPYFDRGRWVYSDCGWYWSSDYSWGWAAFHYGRWFQHNRLGWCWTPGTVWGPSWVCWRQAGDYCGWAPLPPAAGFSVGVGLTFRGRPAGPNCDFALSAGCFPFIRTSDLFASRLVPCALPPAHAANLFAHAQVTSRITHHDGHAFHHGLPPAHVAAITHRELRPVSLGNLPPAQPGNRQGLVTTPSGSGIRPNLATGIGETPPVDGSHGRNDFISAPAHGNTPAPPSARPLVVIGRPKLGGAQDLTPAPRPAESTGIRVGPRTWSSGPQDLRRGAAQETQPPPAATSQGHGLRPSPWSAAATRNVRDPDALETPGPTASSTRSFTHSEAQGAPGSQAGPGSQHRAAPQPEFPVGGSHNSPRPAASDPAPQAPAPPPTHSPPPASGSSSAANSSSHSGLRSRP